MQGLTGLQEIKRTLLRGQDPYAAVDARYVDGRYPHTNLDTALYHRLSAAAPEGYVLEVGSMYGGSAIRMAVTGRRAVVCVDPFTGDTGMLLGSWDHPNFSPLNMENGAPTIRQRFLANVAGAGLTACVLPITCTSTVGLRSLIKLAAVDGELRPGLIYLDSAHEAGETEHELALAWELLPSGGILFGDDWSWPAVEAAVSTMGIRWRAERDAVAELSFDGGRESADGGIRVHGNHWLLVKR